jgi:hypothetical protein
MKILSQVPHCKSNNERSAPSCPEAQTVTPQTGTFLFILPFAGIPNSKYEFYVTFMSSNFVLPYFLNLPLS